MANRTMTFMGIQMAQEWIDLFIWEQFFKDYPLRSFIELGTGYGGLSTYFALQSYQRGLEFHTFDNVTSLGFASGLPALLNIQGAYKCIDIFSDEGQGYVINMIKTAPRPLAIFFDNGNKPREWGIFAPHTQPGDFCIVHDWDTEFKDENLGSLPVERIMTDLCDVRGAGWKAMWFMRK